MSSFQLVIQQKNTKALKIRLVPRRPELKPPPPQIHVIIVPEELELRCGATAACFASRACPPNCMCINDVQEQAVVGVFATTTSPSTRCSTGETTFVYTVPPDCRHWRLSRQPMLKQLLLLRPMQRAMKKKKRKKERRPIDSTPIVYT